MDGYFVSNGEPSSWTSLDLLKHYEYITILHHGSYYIDGRNPYNVVKEEITKELMKRLGILHKGRFVNVDARRSEASDRSSQGTSAT